MGKISDALKKVSKDMETLRNISSSTSLAVEERAKGVVSDKPGMSLKSKIKLKKLSLEDKLRQLYRFSIVKASDSSGIDARIVTYHDYFSPISEQYRVLKTNLKSYLAKNNGVKKMHLAGSNISTHIFTISSALQAEGKTITAINLAVSLARDLESKILLVDCDLRRGTVDKILNFTNKPGFSDLLTEKSDFNSVIYPTRVKNLFVIPSGEPPVSPTELLSSRKMRMVIERIKREDFTHVILDTPPIVPFADAGVLGAQTEGIILVVQAQRTQAKAVSKAKEFIKQANAKFMGFVLTHTDHYSTDLYDSYCSYHSYAEGNGNGSKTANKQ